MDNSVNKASEGATGTIASKFAALSLVAVSFAAEARETFAQNTTKETTPPPAVEVMKREVKTGAEPVTNVKDLDKQLLSTEISSSLQVYSSKKLGLNDADIVKISQISPDNMNCVLYILEETENIAVADLTAHTSSKNLKLAEPIILYVSFDSNLNYQKAGFIIAGENYDIKNRDNESSDIVLAEMNNKEPMVTEMSKKEPVDKDLALAIGVVCLGTITLLVMAVSQIQRDREIDKWHKSGGRDSLLG